MKATVCLLLWMSAGVMAGTPPATRPADEASVEQLLREAHSRRELALRELGQLEGRVDAETRQIMQALDDLMAGKIAALFEPHYVEAENRIQKAGLLDDVSVWKIIWANLKAGVLVSGELEKLCEDYIDKAGREIEPLQEQLARQIAETFSGELSTNLTTAQENIRNEFQAVVLRHFRVMQGVNIAPPPLPPDRIPASFREYTEGALGMASLAGVLALVTTRIIRRLVPKLVAKMAGRVLTKLIPIVGVVLIAWDVWDAATAKRRLENTLRTEFMKEYRESFHADAIWEFPVEGDDGQTFRERTREDVNSLLTQWSIHCRLEAQNILSAAHLLHVSETVQDYLHQQAQRGRNSEEVVQDLVGVWRVFGPLAVRLPIDELIDLQVHADEALLVPVVEQLGEQLLNLYRAQGPLILQAAEAMGPDAFVTTVRTGNDVPWALLRDAFRVLPKTASRDSRRGLLLLIREKFDHNGVAVSSLEKVGQNEDLFLKLAPILRTDRDKLLSLLENARTREALEEGLERDPQSTAIFIKTWDLPIWDRYQDEDRRDALYAVAAIYRERDGDSAIHRLAGTLKEQDLLTPIYLDVGEVGIVIHDAWVTPGSGGHQKKRAGQAIDLYKKGYPLKSLMTEKDLTLAEFCEFFPFAGPLLFTYVEPLGRAAKLVVVLIFAVAVLLVAALILRLFFWSWLMELIGTLRGTGSGKGRVPS